MHSKLDLTSYIIYKLNFCCVQFSLVFERGFPGRGIAQGTCSGRIENLFGEFTSEMVFKINCPKSANMMFSMFKISIVFSVPSSHTRTNQTVNESASLILSFQRSCEQKSNNSVPGESFSHSGVKELSMLLL